MKKLLTILILSCFVFTFDLFSQGNFNGRGFYHPDSLIEVTVTGMVIVDTINSHPIYFLDEDNDGSADYHLNFGPWWYNPDSSNAVRPINGETVTVTGGMHESQNMEYNVIVVYEINGDYWREPFVPYWNNLTRFHHRFGNRHHQNRNFIPGWRHDSLTTVTVSGKIMVDTTFYYNHYYLDLNNDFIPDYFLNFGPHWYEPSSGAVRPNDGDDVSITGGEIQRDSLSVIIVYEINGLIWRDSSNFRTLGGGWLRRNQNAEISFCSAYDSQSKLTFRNGWHHGMMSDSFFCQMLELYPENMPNYQGQNAFAGFAIGVIDPNGMNRLRMGGRMNFNSSVKYSFHYNDTQLEQYGINENSICAKYLDEAAGEWVTVSNASIDTDNNIITFNSNDVSEYIILAENGVTAVDDLTNTAEPDYKLYQNYPNPFNPTTVISFTVGTGQLPVSSNIQLKIYDILGREVATLINEQMSAGSYSVNFDASGLSSGVYFYQLQAGDILLVKKLNLLK